mmetsp:Transcript_28114/g.87104  ORF Transcript_28114/g.87104 Transcript_28114/m.87104 type:complete len:400 (-) Transcript_28114:27-1226(-)
MLQSNREMFASVSLDTPHEVIDETNRGGKDANQEANTEVIIQCMKLALRTSLSNVSMQQKERPLNPTTDFVFKAKVSFHANASKSGGCCSAAPLRDTESSDESDDGKRDATPPFDFTDYAPMCYRHIREFLGVEWQHFQDVLVSSRWHSIPTPGKSTAQLFFCGQNWVVKTMTKEESKFLRDILHRYYYHVRDNPHTLLPHFVGHHSLSLAIDGTQKKVSFVIMQNVFATPNKIHEKFDLKGSTVGRYAAPAERRKQTCTKKDLDINRPIRVGNVRRELLLGQMRRDCDFLKKASIMDYSFLIGIHRCDGSAASVARRLVTEDERCFTADQGGMLSVPGPHGEREVYYVGVIDILQEYNLWKRSETAIRGIVNDASEISSVHPREYAARFVDFMSSIIV